MADEIHTCPELTETSRVIHDAEMSRFQATLDLFVPPVYHARARERFEAYFHYTSHMSNGEVASINGVVGLLMLLVRDLTLLGISLEISQDSDLTMIGQALAKLRNDDGGGNPTKH